MKAHGLLVCLLFLFGAVPGKAQSGPGTLDLEAVGEFRTTSVESQEAGAELAVDVARRNILKDAADRLRNLEEIKAARLKPGQIEAILPALLDIQKAGVQSTPQG